MSRDFFSKCGVPEDVLQSVLVPKPIEAPAQYHSCFISHSSEDVKFAEMLVERLTTSGLVVWYDNRNVQGRRKLVDQFYDAIRATDRLVLVGSESSLASGWVEVEIEEAMRRAEEISNCEDLRRGLIFPIRLLSMKQFDSILERAPADSSFHLLKGFHMRDFTRWREPECFDRACHSMILNLTKDE